MKGVLEAQLGKALGGVPVSVGDVGYELSMPSMHVTLAAFDVSFTLLDTEIDLPEANAMFSLDGLWRLASHEVSLAGLDLDVTLDGDVASSQSVFLPVPCRHLAQAMARSSNGRATSVSRTRD